MDKAVKQSADKQSADFYELVAWFHANRKQVIIVAIIVAVIGAGYGIFVWSKNSSEASANAALSTIRPPMAREGQSTGPADAEPYLKVAQEHSGTAAGARALLIGAGILFDGGKFDQAKQDFDKFFAQYPENPLAIQALVGSAASLEAQGKLADAAAHYDDILKHHGNESAVMPQVKSALARLQVALNHPEEALRLYDDMLKVQSNDSWTAEAGIQREELLAKYPNLRKPVAPPMAPPAATVPVPASKPSATVTVPVPQPKTPAATNSPTHP